MLKEQLLELQKSKKTIFSEYKSSIRFIEDDDVDINTIFDSLQFKSEYTTLKSLNFDRQRLSQREEIKFNKKFSPFLKGLISNTKDRQFDILLEFLIRIYLIIWKGNLKIP